MELTVHPRRMNRPDVAREYEAILANFPNLYLADVNRDIARKAAELRANYNIRPVDALQVATALVYQATAWVTNDKKLKQLNSILDIVIFDDLVKFWHSIESVVVSKFQMVRLKRHSATRVLQKFQLGSGWLT